MTFQERNQKRLEATYEVIWHGGKVDVSGSKGGLLPPYDSSSSWSLVEEVLRTRWDFSKRAMAEPEIPENENPAPDAIPA